MRLSPETVHLIRKMFKDGKSKTSISKLVGVSRPAIDRILSNIDNYRDGNIQKCPICGGRYYTKICLVCKIRKYKEKKRGHTL